ncbi:MAG: galactokinase [Desulfobacterales bacterium]|nr:galactokinase [Desulfobacterales bacterium]
MASAPCRVDMGGTLDIRTFSNVLQHLEPCTVNIALDLRTTVRIAPYKRGWIKVSSRGFQDAEFPARQAPFRHPLGLMFAVAAFFQADGVQVSVHSASPPRSALGGSSVAAVALVGAFMQARHRMAGRPAAAGRSVALMAHAIEESIAGVPCGVQDQLAAVFGGANAWHWLALPQTRVFRREALVAHRRLHGLERHLLAAYAGVPHASADINGRWVRQFISGRRRQEWVDIIACTRAFAEAIRRRDYAAAAAAMNREVDLRHRMTPAVLDSMGRKLVAAARRCGCGARFTGAGGGGCLWAIGEADALAQLRPVWQDILRARRPAYLMEARVAVDGLKVEDEV